MLMKLAQQYIDNPDSIPEEYLKQGYDFLVEYCQENGLDMTKFVKNPENIPAISESIHKSLDWKARILVKKDDIQAAIEPNHKWIITKFNDFKKAEKKATKTVSEKPAKPKKS